MKEESQYHQPARRRRAQQLSVNDLLQRSIEFDKSSPSGRIISAPNAKWRSMALRAGAAIAATAAVIAASQQVTPEFLKSLSSSPVATTHIAAIEQAQPSTLTSSPKALPVEIKLPVFDAQQMTLSNAYIEKLKLDEGKRLVSYLDNGKGSTWTIGYGHTGLMPDGRAIGANMSITDAQADALLILDLNEHINNVVEIIDGMPVTQSQFEALVDFSYNKGAAALADSTLMKKMQAGDHIGAADEYLRWTKITRRNADGTPVLDARGRRVMDEMPGLVTRAQDKRNHMLSAFSERMVDALDRGVSAIQVAERSLVRSQSRIKPLQLSGVRADHDILNLDKAATALDKHTAQIQKKIDISNRLIDKIKHESSALESRYKSQMKATGQHVDANSDQWRGIADLANQAHVLNHIALIHQIERDSDQRKLRHLQDQSGAMHMATQALREGLQTLKAQPDGSESVQMIEDVAAQLQAASDRAQEIAAVEPDPSLGKTILDERQAQRLALSLDRIGGALNEQVDQYAQDQLRRDLARATQN